jgi:hypothetical protein
MAKARPLTPEKQLLKLIEDPKSKTTAVSAQVIKHQGLSLFSFSAWLGRISFLKDWFKRRLKRPKHHEFNLKTISKVLGICIFVLAFYFISNLFTSLISLKKMPNLLLEVKKDDLKPLSLQEASVSKKAVSYFLEKVRARDIFKMHVDKVPKTVIKGPSSGIIEATQHLKLVGISWSNDPDAMIEDTKALRTFFVKRGELIGEIKVQAIFRDKIILSYGGEEIELR